MHATTEIDTAVVIIARGGSKRLPRKNVLPFCGLPLTAWTIIQAGCSRLVDKVFLSTDDDEIEDIGRTYGAEIIRRPDWPDADQVAANRVYLHAIDEIAARGYDMRRMISAFPTSPLRFPDDIDRGIEHHNIVGWHVQPFVKNRETCLYRNVTDLIAKLVVWDKSHAYMTGNSGLYNITYTSWYKHYVTLLTTAHGDYDKALDDVSSSIMEHPDTDTYFVECEPWQAVETDTLEEFELAQVLMEHYILKGRGPEIYYDYKELADAIGGDDDRKPNPGGDNRILVGGTNLSEANSVRQTSNGGDGSKR